MAKAVVAGALGLVGSSISNHLLTAAGWEVLGLARSTPRVATDFTCVAVDLLDREACFAQAGRLKAATHVFYCARASRGDPAEEAAVNREMLVNLIEALESAGAPLRHIQLVHGTKWYGSHLGPYRTPAREDDPRHMPPNFYYDQQDYVAALQKERNWTWSAVRPHIVCGFSAYYPHNAMMVLAAYGTLCRHYGLPLRFPGSSECFRSVSMLTDARLLAKAMLWAASEPRCANEAFNIINGDYFRWENVWPALADFFGVPAGPVQQIRLADMMADKGPVWDRIVRDHGLQPYRLDDLVNWRFGDFIFAAGWDDMSSMVKARRHGFVEAIDSEHMLLDQLAAFRRDRIIP